MRLIRDPTPGNAGGRLLVMLPAAMARPEDLLAQGFVAALRSRRLPLDVAIADAQPDYYLDQGIGERLAADVIAPMRSEGYRRIWLMGMSLGGMGSVACACRDPAEIEGAILLAPFLGTRDRIAQILQAGGLARWQPDAAAPDDEGERLLRWLKHYRADAPGLPALYLGFGRADRYVAASEMLAPQLPPERVAIAPGAHDWHTWLQLWEMLLDRHPFPVQA